ncbi:hypothetical protein [Agromyces sp. H66]|uniref:DprA-like winged helix domain-containing protein n=1 Tax=Agromyces sp. H66 TaxID=2529859 RepID=UPI0024A7421C|nr:hypothetical protein [Agromyces sp. H66]
MAELAGGGEPVRARGDVRPNGARRRGGPADLDQDVAAPSPDVLRVTDALSTRSPRSIDEIARRSGMSVREVMGVLGPLELHGVAMRRDDGWIRRSKG